MRTPRALLAASACVAVVALLAAGCGSSANTSITPREITFPVLWAGSSADGTPAAGIEPATIAVGTEGDAQFTLDLDDVRAKKAGAQWLAATTSAAAVATLLTGADQSAVDLRYGITGAIDGPSGGAALTVGTMAAITGDPVKPKVVMTGTISPDGTVGTVSQVPAKVRAAKKAGYELVLVPWGSRREFDPQSGRDVSLPALGKSLGIEVRVVRSVGEAYRAFTGSTIVPPPKAKPVITPRALEVAQRTTRRSVAALSREFAAGGSLLSAQDRAAIAPEVQRAQSALAAGQIGLAYGLSVHATYVLKRALAKGASRALARMRGVAAAVAEDQRASIERFGPDAVALVKASESRTEVPEEAAAEFLDGYSTFLSRAGADSRRLYETQAGPGGLASAAQDATAIDPVLEAVSDEAEAAAESAGSLREAITMSAYATTYYV
ncbi:MAG: S16 family serine protease, partial [Phycisphaerales bacterium]